MSDNDDKRKNRLMRYPPVGMSTYTNNASNNGINRLDDEFMYNKFVYKDDSDVKFNVSPTNKFKHTNSSLSSAYNERGEIDKQTTYDVTGADAASNEDGIVNNNNNGNAESFPSMLTKKYQAAYNKNLQIVQSSAASFSGSMKNGDILVNVSTDDYSSSSLHNNDDMKDGNCKQQVRALQVIISSFSDNNRVDSAW
jgi:hypothetical protein